MSNMLLDLLKCFHGWKHQFKKIWIHSLIMPDQILVKYDDAKTKKYQKKQSVSKNWKGLNGGIVWLDLCSPYQKNIITWVDDLSQPWPSVRFMGDIALISSSVGDFHKFIQLLHTFAGYSPCSVALFIWLSTTKANITWTIWHTNNFIQKNVNKNPTAPLVSKVGYINKNLQVLAPELWMFWIFPALKSRDTNTLSVDVQGASDEAVAVFVADRLP